MAISIYKKKILASGLFYDPNIGVNVVDSCHDFRNFIDKLHEVWPAFGYAF